MISDEYRTTRELERIKGEMAFHLAVFGDTLAEREGYREYSGIEAVHFYLCNKYHWLPSVVQSMSNDDLRFLLGEEMRDWTLPNSAMDK